MTTENDVTMATAVSDSLFGTVSSDDNATTQAYNVNNTLTTANVDPLISLKVPAIMFTSGVIGNILAIVVLLRSSKEHKQTVFYRLVGALAITDLFGTCATSPVTLAVYANNLNWVGGDALCNYESFMMIFAGYSTIFIIGTMALDRFMALTKPFYYDTHITPGRAKFIILGIWGFAAFLGLLPVMGLGENVKQFPGSWCFFSFVSPNLKNKIFSYMYATIGLITISVTALSNVVVTSTLLKMRRAAIKTMGSGNTKRNDSELQMVILLLGIIVIFSTCWCPFLIRILINQSHERQINVRADLHALRLASFNQILDPWIYILFRKELFVRVYQCVRNIVAGQCACLCRERRDSVYEDGDVGNGADSRFIDIPFQKYENEENVLLADSDKSLQEKGDRAFGKEEETTTLNGSVRSSKMKACASRQVSFNNESVKQKPLNDFPGPHLHLKHSACLFCFSNHAKCVILASKSMDGLHLLNDAASRPENRPGIGRQSKTCSPIRRESIHMSMSGIGNGIDAHRGIRGSDVSFA